jgi:hypothetical protein
LSISKLISTEELFTGILTPAITLLIKYPETKYESSFVVYLFPAKYACHVE